MPLINRASKLLRSGLFVCLAATTASAQTITSFDVPGSQDTLAFDINRAGTVVGYYVAAGPAGLHGFLRDAGGSITTFDAPGAVDTRALSINRSGSIAGYAFDGTAIHGFVRDPSGAIVVFDATPAASDTRAVSINTAGETTGFYLDGAGYRSFVRDESGAVVTFGVPNAIHTYAAQINSAGVVTGCYRDVIGFHGFVRMPYGDVTLFDAVPGGYDTVATSINDFGAVTGDYLGSSSYLGFVRQITGEVTSFDVDANADYVIPMSINIDGVITGYFEYYDTTIQASTNRGFVRTASGVNTTFAPAGAIATTPWAINAVEAITGSYLDAIGYHGFIRSGRAPVTIPTDLHAGERYHLMFVTAGEHDAVSSNIADYDEFVRSEASLSPNLQDLGAAWRVVGSTSTSFARTHTDIVGPVYNLIGQRLADGLADMFDGSLSAPVGRDQFGITTYLNVWTGSTHDGQAELGYELGSITTSPSDLPQAVIGTSGGLGPSWLSSDTERVQTPLPFYAISDALVVPGSQAPTITSVVATPNLLWPANHKMIAVSIAVAASTVRSNTPAPTCRVDTVSSSEPITKPGQVDWVINGPLKLQLRAERSGSGPGRTYTITVRCTNSSGLSATKSTAVVVPHDRSK